MNDPVFVIAEAGVNHNGSLDLALRLVDAAADARADAVKFQTFSADRLASRHAEKADYQKQATASGGGQLAMLKALELDLDDHFRLKAHAEESGLEFMSTPFDLASGEFLVRQLGVRRLKISSGDVTDAPLLHGLAGLGTPMILSTGMSSLLDVERALGVLAHSLTSTEPASLPAFERAFRSEPGSCALREKVSLLHCTTQYPARPASVHLRAMGTLRETFGLVTGYSDHTLGIHVSLAAVARGARIIEKHVTLDRGMPGPDHEASLEPAELTALIAQIRDLETALGSAEKRVLPEEEANRQVARKSIVAGRAIEAGEVFSAENLAVKRPLGGAQPMIWWELLGTPARRSYSADEPIDG